jgi:hypothetical protein
VPDATVPLVLLATLAILLVLLVALFLARRTLLTRGLGTFDCSLRLAGPTAAGAWMLGVGRYESDRLDWFRVFTLSPRPGRSLARSKLVLLERRSPTGSESYAVLPGSVIVSCGHGSLRLELAMSEEAYDGLTTWLESAPPGQTSFVT